MINVFGCNNSFNWIDDFVARVTIAWRLFGFFLKFNDGN
jgi:hypothetical protein